MQAHLKSPHAAQQMIARLQARVAQLEDQH